MLPILGRLRCSDCGAGLVPAYARLCCPQGDDCQPNGREVLNLVAASPPE